MAISQPTTFDEAVAAASRRRLMPTTLSSYELSRIDVGVRRQSVFSARVADAVILQEIYDTTNELAAGNLDRATARLRLKQVIASTGYIPQPGDEGTIKDLRTNGRLNLIIDTQVRMAQGYGQWTQSNLPGAALVFPCQELIREEARMVPRGFIVRRGALIEREGDPGYWQNRWRSAGGRLFRGRMIARLDDPVWTAISRFGLPWPPFDFNSGYGLRRIGRKEAVQLGVITQGERVEPASMDLDQNVSASLDGINDAILEALIDSLPTTFEIVNDILRSRPTTP